MGDLKKHGYVHLGWIIGVLLVVVAVLLVRNPSSDKLQELLGFAATLASLLLAVIAIFYAMISSQGQSDIMVRTADAASKADEAANFSSGFVQRHKGSCGRFKG